MFIHSSSLFSVIILAFGGMYVRDIMLQAFDLQLVGGDYAFIAINPKRSGRLLPDEQWAQVSVVFVRNTDKIRPGTYSMFYSDVTGNVCFCK